MNIIILYNILYNNLYNLVRAYRRPGCHKAGLVEGTWRKSAAFLCCTASVRTPPCFAKKALEEYADKVCY